MDTTKEVKSFDTESFKKKDKYPKYNGKSDNVFEALKSSGENDVSMDNRINIAIANNIPTSNTTIMNAEIFNKLKSGTLKKV